MCVMLVLAMQPTLAQPRPESMHAYTVQSGDTLIGLSERLLIHPPHWPELAKLNRIAHPKRIPVGSVIRIPLRLLKSEAVSATILSTTGKTRLVHAAQGEQSVQVGNLFKVNEEIHTGTDGYVTVRLADGSELRIQPSSIVRLERAEHYTPAGFFKMRLKLIQGRVDSLVKRASSTPPSLEIQTPQATMGVRGTEFRTIAGLTGKAVSAAEVISGTVMAGALTPVQAGYGVRVEAAKPPSVVQLLPAPAFLPEATQRQERSVIRLPIQTLPNAQAYRLQLARDALFQDMQAETVSTTADLRLTNVPDGAYHAKVRGIDAQGLEGLDVVAQVVVKAHPQAPMTLLPAARMKIRANEVTFEWASNPEAVNYHLQVARLVPGDQPTNLWAAPAIDQAALKDIRWQTSLPPGDYLWRMASIRQEGDMGPWGDPQPFSLLRPPTGMAPPQVTRQHVTVQWSGEPGQTFEFQVARQPDFSRLLLSQSVYAPEAVWARPDEGGRLYMRYRATDADGFVGPYSTVQVLELPPCLKSPNGQCLRDQSGNTITSR
jgi:hypothetical protein